MLKEFDLNPLVEPLLEWYEGHARVLPWREEPTPYCVWVSEIMLQQTRVEAVKPYFERFMKALPDLHALAVCPEEELLKLWEGLGYYNRVKNLQIAARQVEEFYGGELPQNYEELLKLKGIGHYTAGAILSIAYEIPAPAVDGNVFRVLTRVSTDDHDILKASFRTEVEECLLPVLPVHHARAFTQALMELGATVCVPNGEPHCAACPWEAFCMAHKKGEEEAYPVKSKAKPRRMEERTILVIRDGDSVVLQKRPEKGLLSGMYEFPGLEGKQDRETVLSYVKALGLAPLHVKELQTAKHIFSHVEWHMIGYMIRVEELEKVPEGLILADAQTAEQKYAIPSAYRAYTEYMNIRLGNEKYEKE